MNIAFYSYGNIVRILYIDAAEFTNSLMIDVNLDTKKVISVFDASKKFDADFIMSFLNILRESSAGFKKLSDAPGQPPLTKDGELSDELLRAKAINFMGMNPSVHPKVPEILSLLGF